MSDIWYMLGDHERYVYHYTKAQTLVQHILPESRLRLSRFEEVNDPAELKDWSFSIARAEHLNREDDKFVQDIFNKKLKRDWHVGCFASDIAAGVVTPDLRGTEAIQTMYERGHSLPRMWAQYGDQHRGVCLVLSRASLDRAIAAGVDKDGAVYSGLVTYKNSLPVPQLHRPGPRIIDALEVAQLGPEESARRHLDRFHRELLFTKTRDWEGEREFRWCILRGRPDRVFVDIRGSLLGIALGDQFPDELELQIGNYCEANNVSVAFMKWQNGFPQPYLAHPRILIYEAKKRASQKWPRLLSRSWKRLFGAR